MIAVLLLFGAAGPLAAQAPDSAFAPTITAARLKGELHLDGRLDDAAWSAATPVAGLVQRDPDEGQPPTERTEIRVLLGDDALYVGVRLFDREPARIRALLTRRDEPSESDRFTVQLDSRHDHLTGFLFEVNPRGVRRDGVIQADGTVDYAPDPVWEAEVRQDESGWSAEIRIPLSQLRFNRSGDTWGVQFTRFIQRKGEEDVFSFVPKNQRNGVNRYGHLTGLVDLPAAHHAEIAPYLSGRGEYTHPPPGDPFRDGNDYFEDAGTDLKLGVGSNLTLDATINPDFGQVEVDPARVNLSEFELFFPEKRPFFLEGSSLFSFAQVNAWNQAGFPNVFNSRRIGRSPQLGLGGPNVVSADVPVETRIPGALKLTGKTAGGWSLAILDAVTREEKGRFVDTLGAVNRVPVEPLTNYFVGRLRRESADGNTAVGGLFTAVDRQLDDPTLAGALRSSAYLGGLDLTRYWNNQSWALDAFVTGSLVRGSPGAIALTQRSPARYYQRPDAGRFSLDSTRTALAGFNAVVALTKLSGRHWLGSVALQDKSPGYETNDVGFEVFTNRRALATDLAYVEYRPGRWFRSYRVDGYSTQEWDYEWNNVTNYSGATQVARLRNFWQWQLETDFFTATTDDHLTRGGPLARAPGGVFVRAQVNSDSRKRHTFGLAANYTRTTATEHSLTVSPSLTINPGSNLQIRLAPSLSVNHNLGQFVQSVPDSTATATFGSRYVFATLRQTSLALEARLNWTFTPTLSLQLYAQPLLVSNGFSDYKELRAVRSYDFDIYGRDRGTIAPDGAGGFTVDPDGAGPAAAFNVGDQNFNFRALRANVVLRWEYRPGAALFLVWQQSRTDAASGVSDFDFGRDFRALRFTPADNVLALKASYWVGI